MPEFATSLPFGPISGILQIDITILADLVIAEVRVLPLNDADVSSVWYY